MTRIMNKLSYYIQKVLNWRHRKQGNESGGGNQSRKAGIRAGKESQNWLACLRRLGFGNRLSGIRSSAWSWRTKIFIASVYYIVSFTFVQATRTFTLNQQNSFVKSFTKIDILPPFLPIMSFICAWGCFLTKFSKLNAASIQCLTNYSCMYLYLNWYTFVTNQNTN